MDRPDISKLNKNRSIYLKLGFVISLSLTVMAFNYTVYDQKNETYKPIVYEKDDLVEVQRTVYKVKKVPPPLSLKPTEKFIDEEVIFDPEPVPEPVVKKILAEPTIKPRPIPIALPEPKPVVLPVEPEVTVPEIFEIVEQMPRFAGCENMGLSDSDLKGCSDNKMLEYIYSKVKYPPLARENGIEGIVVASFVVERDGSISGLKIARDIGGGCGKEVLRIVKDMPNWIPGEQRRRKVRVRFNLPVKFKLN